MEQEIRKILRCPICEKGRIADAPAGAALSQYRLFAMVGNEPADITCVIAILDERAGRGRRYNKAMLDALPEMRTTSSLRAVTKFLRELKPESYFEVCA